MGAQAAPFSCEAGGARADEDSGNPHAVRLAPAGESGFSGPAAWLQSFGDYQAVQDLDGD